MSVWTRKRIGAPNIGDTPGLALWREHPLARGLTAYWPLTEPAGPPQDLLGERPGIPSGSSLPARRATERGPAITGAADRSEVFFNLPKNMPAIAAVNTTVSLWTSTTFTGASQVWLGLTDGSNWIALGRSNTELLTHYYVSGAAEGLSAAVVASSGLSNGQLHHVVLTQRGTNKPTIYVDGVAVGSTAVSTSWGSRATSATCGRANPPANYALMTDTLQNIAVWWDRVLTADEVRQL
ncbi:MAG TPA: hypothetical protein PKZ08_10695, partial [Vicinamibacterales bacterium]|nr:hypothetical protein [Vicinamibacterales bacterium]